ncbi:hypothetical protein E2C01_014332 [Portunus trituberculatus]|uniref:Uncharacterized protein n=1 Tax=Portunus trituberculatus TaxID=210409 RepID=A0A5B7DJU3_PORTR|nr:hypothetical protein [Portunus trituberculatus]
METHLTRETFTYRHKNSKDNITFRFFHGPRERTLLTSGRVPAFNLTHSRYVHLSTLPRPAIRTCHASPHLSNQFNHTTQPGDAHTGTLKPLYRT